MSAQTDSPINREINETNQTYNVDPETITAIEKTLNNETETDLSALKITKDIVLQEEIINTKTNGNKKSIPEETIKKDSLTKDTKSNVSINIPNGISLGCSQNPYESESKIQNLDMSNSDEPAMNKTVKLQPSLLNNGSKHLEHLTKPDEPLCENSKTSLEDTSNTTASVNIHVPGNGLESDQMNCNDFTLGEHNEVIRDACGSNKKKSNNETKDMELTTADTKYAHDIIMDDEYKVSQAFGDAGINEPNILINKEVKDLASNETNILINEEDKDVALVTDKDIAVHEIINEEVEDSANNEKNMLINDEVKVLGNNETNILINEEYKDLALVTDKDVAMRETINEKVIGLGNNETNILKNEEDKDLANNETHILTKEEEKDLPKYETKILINEEDKDFAQVNDKDVSMHETTNEEAKDLANNETNILTNKDAKDLAPVDQDVAMHEVVNKEDKVLALVDDEDVAMHEVHEIGVNELPILPISEDLKLIKTDAEVLSPLQTSIHITSPEAHIRKPVKMNEEEILPLQTSESVTSIVAEDLNTPKIIKDEKVSPLVQTCETVILPVESTLIPIEKTEEKLPSNLNSDQCAAINISEEETDDVIMTEVTETSINVASQNITQLKDDASKTHFNNIQKIDASSSRFTQKSDENKVMDYETNKYNDSMEMNVVEIVNVEKDNHNEICINNSEITSNEDVFKDTVVKDTIELEITSEMPAKVKVYEYIAVRKDLKSNKADNKTVSEESSKIILVKEPTKNIHTTKYLENGETPVTRAENNNECKNTIEKEVRDLTIEGQENFEIIDEDDCKFVDIGEEKITTQTEQNSPERQEINTLPVVCKLSNTLDILSDDEEEASNAKPNVQPQTTPDDKLCIDLDDDDDIMLIEEDSNSQGKPEVLSNKEETEPKPSDKVDEETGEKHSTDITDLMPKANEKDNLPENISRIEADSIPEIEDNFAEEDKPVEKKTPLLPRNFLRTAKKNLADMSRHELEDFCILRIVESIVDRSNLSEIKTKMKKMAQNLDDLKKRATMMTKQNRDLQVVMKSVQEEQKNQSKEPIKPLKITRSVGMQVLVPVGAGEQDKLDPRKKPAGPGAAPPAAGPATRPARAAPTKQAKPPLTPPTIPVPRKVPVNSSPAKPLTITPTSSAGNKSVCPLPNGLRYSPPVQKVPEKRTHSRAQSTSVTVDLTDDEPPAKVSNKSSPSQPVRVVAPQNLLAQQRQFPPLNNNARKVYIPISGTQAQQIRSSLVMKNMAPPGPRLGPRPPIPRAQPIPAPVKTYKHPAPLPDSMKQYTPAAWKSLPPAPDLKLSKVENGIVISWKIDGYPESLYESIASYQLYAYQETNTPPNTALWKKIGDVKALPLPMACTLTQFMAGFKYYFAVRAVDVRSRMGPFSLPGSILLLNKV